MNLLQVLDKADPAGTFLLDSVTALLSNEMFPGPEPDLSAPARVKDDLLALADSGQWSMETLAAASGMAGMGTANSIRTRKITGRFYLCGDEVSDAADTLGLVAPRVMLCAAHQAHTVLRILAGEYDV